MDLKKGIYFLFLNLLFGCTAGDIEMKSSTWADVQTQGEGVITLVYVPSDGFSYENEEGRLTGVTIELVRDFVEFLNNEYSVDVTIQTKAIESFSEFYNYVVESESGVFGVANVTITEARKEELQFSPPYLTNIATLITHSDVVEISGLENITEQFIGLNALAFEGTLHEVRLRRIIDELIPEADIDFASSNNEIIEKVSEENRYFAYVDIYNYWRAIERGEPLRRHSAGDEASEQFGVISPADSDWSEVMDLFFEKDGGYVGSERYSALLSEHLGEELAALLSKGQSAGDRVQGMH